jgi:hypothetical protein
MSTEATQAPIVVHNRCKSCRAQIRFEKTEYGSTMPFDAEPVLVGGAYELEGGTARFVPKDKREGKPLFTPHFATCPKADQHRRRK